MHPHPTEPNLEQNFMTDIRLNAFNNWKIAGRIFIKFGNGVPLQTTPNQQVLTFVTCQYRRNGCSHS
jgi:hypothetical protein